MTGQLHNGVRVRDLASTSALSRAELRAGEGGLDRRVGRVQWMEVLDDFDTYLAPGDLLLTTAYNLRDDRDLQRGLAARMDACGVAAMVVKCGHYLDVVPYAVCREADRLGLPVFELRREIPFVELAGSISEQLTSRSHARLRQTAAMHGELLRLVADGDGLPALVARAAAILGAPVAVEDDRGRPLAGAAPDGTPVRLATAVLRRGEAHAVAPVRGRGRLQGRVALLAAAGDDDGAALEQLATIVALEITRDDAARAEDDAALAALVADVVGDAPSAVPLAARRAAALGVELPPAPAVLRAPAPDRARALEAAPDGVPAAVVDGELVALLAEDRPPPWLAAAGIAEAGIGRPGGGPGGAGRSHRQAARALVLGRALRGPGVHRFADVEAYDALLAAVDDGRGDEIRRRTLDALSGELRRTFTAFLETGGGVSETAGRLFVHRNTVHYRMRRIRELTGLDPTRLEDRVLCELALLAERLSAAAGAGAQEGLRPPTISVSRDSPV